MITASAATGARARVMRFFLLRWLLVRPFRVMGVSWDV
jgi:hypothetical protein